MKSLIKNYYLLFVFFLSCSGGSDSPTEVVNDIDPEPVTITDSFKKILSDEYNTETFKFGATLNYYQFDSNVEDLFLKEFDYLVAENSFKQTIVHPEPDVWNWERVDAVIDFANKNRMFISVK